MLHLSKDTLEQKPLLLQWFQYTELYRSKMGANSFTDEMVFNLMFDHKSFLHQAQLFSTIKEVPDMKKYTKDMHNYLFQTWIHKEVKPKRLEEMLAAPGENIMDISRRDPRYTAVKAYTMYLAKSHGGKALVNKVDELFARNDPMALITAVKTQ